jgi:uncharacterized membrane protein YjjP (DUF1212 family)
VQFEEQRETRERFIVRVAELLHAQGTPAHRGEELTTRLGATLGVPTQVSFSPTELLLSFGAEPDVRTLVRRMEPGSVELGRLAQSSEVLDDVFAGRIRLDAARRRLESIARRKPLYGRLALTVATGVTAASAAPLLGGGLTEVLVAAVLGMVVAEVERFFRGSERWQPMAEPLSALVVGFLSHALSRSFLPHADGVVALATLIVLVPGLTFTTALVEVATRHWAAGTARMAGAFGTFLSLTVGVAIGRVLAEHCIPGTAVAVPEIGPLSTTTIMVATGFAALSFGVLFQARPQSFGWIVLACIFGSLGSMGGTALLGPQLGAVGGALVLGILSNGYSGGGRRPALVLLTPGILLLVPGAVGYRALSMLMSHNVLAGLESGMEMLIIATSLVAGLLLANGVLPPRRPL